MILPAWAWAVMSRERSGMLAMPMMAHPKEYVIHVLPRHLPLNGSKPTIAIRPSWDLEAKPILCHDLLITESSRIQEHFDSPIPGTDGRGVVTLRTYGPVYFSPCEDQEELPRDSQMVQPTADERLAIEIDRLRRSLPVSESHVRSSEMNRSSARSIASALRAEGRTLEQVRAIDACSNAGGLIVEEFIAGNQPVAPRTKVKVTRGHTLRNGRTVLAEGDEYEVLHVIPAGAKDYKGRVTDKVTYVIKDEDGNCPGSYCYLWDFDRFVSLS
jgi:hypothetical protein